MADALGVVPEEVVALLEELVRIPSHTGLERQEERVVEALEAFLAARDLPTRRVEAAPGRPNLLCEVRGAHAGRHLLLCGHTDTVPLNEGDPGDGFSARIVEGRMFGRGTADMKGGLAAMAGAMAALKRTGVLEKGTVTLAAVVDEEMQSLGAESLVQSNLGADGAIVGEPTSNVLCLGHKGLEWLEIEFAGRAAHGGTPEAGLSAISAAARFVRLIETEYVPKLKERSHALLGPATINIGTVHGGDQPSTVAAACRLTADRRLLPGESYASICQELDRFLARIEEQMPGLRTRIRRVPGGMSTLEHFALITEPEHPLSKAVIAAAHEVTGAPGRTGVFPAWTDGALLANFGGIPSVVLGPGDLSLAHSPHESVELDQVVQAARIYTAAGRIFCGQR
ncbi:MAG: M20 family metallopeptidase [Elusimicrobia bacterium]|nr:M20 family metallopeptidase [Elusimicrobiota bacterium]